ncbi:MAG: hypothetical protein ACP5R4_06065 [Armatimonadota bacterium]
MLKRVKIEVDKNQKLLAVGVVAAFVLAVVLAAIPGGTSSGRSAATKVVKSRTAASTPRRTEPVKRSWQEYERIVAKNPFRPLVTKSNGERRSGVLPAGMPGALPPVSLAVQPIGNTANEKSTLSGWAFVGTVSVGKEIYGLLENRKQSQGGYYKAGDMSPLGKIQSVTTEFISISTPRGVETLPLVSGDTVAEWKSQQQRAGRTNEQSQPPSDDELLRVLEAALLGGDQSGGAQTPPVVVMGPGGPPGPFPPGMGGFGPPGGPGRRFRNRN